MEGLESEEIAKSILIKDFVLLCRLPMIRNWLDRCRDLRQLNFISNYIIRYNINSAERSGYLPLSLDKLKWKTNI